MQTQLPDFKKASILVIGDVMLDRYWFGSTARISPEAPVPVVQIQQKDERPGGAANVALNIAALGAEVILLGVIGKDEAGHTLQTQLTAGQVKHDLLECDQIDTITKLRVMSRHQQLIRLDFEEKFCNLESKKLIAIYKRYLSQTDWIILSDYNKGTLECAPELIQLANIAGIPVLVDPKGNNFHIYRGATGITPNLREFEGVAGIAETEKSLAEKAQKFLTDYQIKTLLLTRGERGMTLFQEQREEVHLPAHAREVFDVTGAGDTVIAVFGAALAAGATPAVAMELANLAASLVVAKLGTACITAPELQAAVNTQRPSHLGILNEEQLMLAVAAARQENKKIVFTNGCFDILHAGHVLYLQQAKALGDYLIVAVNDDISVKRNKGETRPLNQVEQRMMVLAGLGVVDWVVAFGDDTPERLLWCLQPDILVKGGDYEPDQVVGSEIVQRYGGEVRTLGVMKDVSTSRLIDRIVKSHQSTGAAD